ncbi:MAG: CRISPR system precrRNA processing endoribonuclease RAMP protein Cas6 [Candidatus Odinarchaeota archaeon]|nr:CRISPR system precrRNA processing endoribonuclease RAMP protein Cas6 [Candidatus Odinarchaeota archaeon]
MLINDHPLIRHYEIFGEFDDDFSIFPWMGTTIRGVFGYTLRRISCTTRLSSCDNCKLKAKCPYNIIFETSAASFYKDFGLGYKLKGITKPYTLTNLRIRSGRFFNFDLNAFGAYMFANEPLLVKVLVNMQSAGFGRCSKTNKRRTFKIAEILVRNPLTGEEETIYDSSTYHPADGYRKSDISLDAFLDYASAIFSKAPGLLKLTFATPTLIEIDGESEVPPRMKSVFQNLTRKITFLSSYFWRRKNALFELDEIKRVANAIETNITIETANIKSERMTRYSLRKKKWLQIPGYFSGAVYYKINKEFYEDQRNCLLFTALKLGEFLHVGKFTTSGAGEIKLEFF